VQEISQGVNGYEVDEDKSNDPGKSDVGGDDARNQPFGDKSQEKKYQHDKKNIVEDLINYF
jgi:hypothetical protein